MYEETLTHAGLLKNEAIVYETLLKNGEMRASRLAASVSMKRGLVYKILDDLVYEDLVEKKEVDGGVTTFFPKHPLNLKELAERREQKAHDAKLALEGVLPSIVSDFNLISGRPGVQFYEGLEGIKKVLEDSLDNNSEGKILTFSDVAGYARYLREWNTKRYAPKRKRLGIQEKVIIPNNEEAVAYMKGYKANEVTEILFVDHKKYPFKTEINVYSNKVTFVTFSEKGHIGFIVENKEIYNTMRSLHLFFWEIGRKYCKDIQPEWLKKQYPALYR